MKVIPKRYLGFVLQLNDASSMQTVHDIDNTVAQSHPIFFGIPEENDDEENNIIYTHIQK